MRNLVFKGKAWDNYLGLQKNKAIHKKLLAVLREMQRGDPGKGTGKPEQLKGNLTGLWSRRISEKDRVVYYFDSENIHVVAIGGHYENF